MSSLSVSSIQSNQDLLSTSVESLAESYVDFFIGEPDDLSSSSFKARVRISVDNGKCGICFRRTFDKADIQKVVSNWQNFDRQPYLDIFPLKLRCGHKFHNRCIKPSIVLDNTCFTCKTPVIELPLIRGKFQYLKGPWECGGPFKTLLFTNTEANSMIKEFSFLTSTVNCIASRIFVKYSERRKEELDTYFRMNGHLLMPIGAGYRTDGQQQFLDVFALLTRDNDFPAESLSLMRSHC